MAKVRKKKVKVSPEGVAHIKATFNNTLITLSTFEILLICQSFCGCSLILAPLAPPRLSDPLKVEAEAHAVETN